MKWKLALASLGLCASFSLAVGCSNPANDVAPAKVDEPKVAPIPPATKGEPVPPVSPEAKPAAAAPTPAPAPAPTSAPEAAKGIAITPANSKIEFVGSKVTGSHNGSFKAFAGTFEPGADSKIESGKIKAEIDMDSTDSDEANLTTHLKSADFFDVAKYPKSTFESTEIKPGANDPKAKDATHTVTGNFTLHGVTKSISFPAKIEGGADHLDLDSTFAINRKDFKIEYAGKADNLIRDGVVIKLTIHAKKG